MFTDQKNILLVQLYANGDCLYATTVAKQIKIDFPNCTLTWAVSPSSKSMLLNNPDIDHIVEITSVPKDNNAAFRKFKKSISNGDFGKYDLVFNVQVMDTNLANYDGCIRSAIFRAYPNKINVSLKPTLYLTDNEKLNVSNFIERKKIKNYKHVILFECAPQSGQSIITFEKAVSIAERLSEYPEVAIILSSANKLISKTEKIIDGSELTIRETAFLTHFCTLLLGSSSGLTWISTSSAAKQLPMIQILNPEAPFFNPVSRDFNRNGLSTENLIEILNFDEEKLVSCISASFKNFEIAKKIYNQNPPLVFTSSRKIIYNLLCYLEFSAIIKHIKINYALYGFNIDFIKEICLGFVIAPFKLIYNLFRKRILISSLP